jgi:hypothetical protein
MNIYTKLVRYNMIFPGTTERKKQNLPIVLKPRMLETENKAIIMYVEPRHVEKISPVESIGGSGSSCT